MAKFFQAPDGSYGLRVGTQEAVHPVPGGSTVVAFDEATNQALLDSLAGKAAPFKWQDHTISGGQILRSGVAQTINADSPDKQDRDDFDTQLAAFYAAMQTYLGIADTATNAQVRDQTKRLTQGMVRICKIVKLLRPKLEN